MAVKLPKIEALRLLITIMGNVFLGMGISISGCPAWATADPVSAV